MTVNVAAAPVAEVKLLPLIVGVMATCVPLNVAYSGGVTVNVHCDVPVGTAPYVNVTLPPEVVFVTAGHDEPLTQEPKSWVVPSPVIAVEGNETAVPAQFGVTLHDTVTVNVVAAPLGVVAVAGVTDTLAPEAGAAGSARGANIVADDAALWDDTPGPNGSDAGELA